MFTVKAPVLAACFGLATSAFAEIVLEFPQLDGRQYREGPVPLAAPETITKVYIHVPGLTNAKVYTRINALGVGTIQSLRARKSGLLAVLDLTMHAGRYAFEPGTTNTIEVKVEPRDGSATLYSNWALVSAARDATRITPAVNRAIITPGPMADALVLDPISLEVRKGDAWTPLDRRITDSDRLQLTGLIKGATAATKVRIQRAGAGVASAGTRGISISVETGSPAAGSPATGSPAAGSPAAGSQAAFSEEVDLVEGSNAFEIVLFEGDTPQVAYGVSVIRQSVRSSVATIGTKWAVVIGISDYQHEGISDLDYADDDAKAFYDFLISDSGGAYATQQVKLLLDANATAQNIRTAFFNFLARSRPEDLVMIYFAGHGSPDSAVNPDNHFLMAHDTDPKNMGGTAVPMWDLRNVLDFTIKARRAIVFADACHSGSAVTTRVANSRPKMNFVNKYLESLAREGGRMVVTASRADEYSAESSEWGGGHGVFTYTLLEGLKGAGDYDDNGVVTVAEALDYLETRVPEATGGSQHPTYRKVEVNPTLPLSTPSLSR